MTRRMDIPAEYSEGPFRFGDARSHGVSKAQLDRDDLLRPHWGVRSNRPITTHLDLCRSFEPRMKSWHAFAGASAALMWGLPLPFVPGVHDRIAIVVPEGRHAPEGPAVRSMRIRAGLWETTEIDGLAVATPLLTWLTLARWADRDALVSVGDALVTRADNYPGRGPHLPRFSPGDLQRYAAGLGNVTGAARLRSATALVQDGVESPMETRLRLTLLDAGFPTPEVNGNISENGVFLGRGDLVFRAAKVVIEYEGRIHRESDERFSADMSRVLRLEAAGWRVVRVGVDDLRDGAADLIRTIATALAR